MPSAAPSRRLRSTAEIDGPLPPDAHRPAIVRVNAKTVVTALRDGWIASQADYHEKNRLKMGRMREFFYKWGSS